MKVDYKKKVENIKAFILIVNTLIFIFLGITILQFIANISMFVTPRGRERLFQNPLIGAIIIGFTITLGIGIVLLFMLIYKSMSFVFSKTPMESPSGSYKIPSTIKNKVWERDNGSCVKCKSKENIKFDKIIPMKLIGSNRLINVQLLCEACFKEKYSEYAEKEEFFKRNKKNILKYSVDYEKFEEIKKEETILWQVEKKELLKGRIVTELNYFITNWRIIKCPKDFDITLFLNGLFSVDDKKRIKSKYISTIGRIEAIKLDDKWQINFFRSSYRSPFSKMIGIKRFSFKNLNQKEKEEAIAYFIAMGIFSLLKDNVQISILNRDW